MAGQDGLAAVALLAPPEVPPDDLPDDPFADPDDPDPDEPESLDGDVEEVELVDDSDLPLEPFGVVSEPEDRESVR
ncbi:hypothetical protein [Micromonospora sp. HNM0581]|uniref:hypothetical protein n=1 Tax=Micromonospora sp. HNM0581 TaxID=2716341 RepID=UPI0032167E8E